MPDTNCELMQKLYDERFTRDKERIEHIEDLTTKVSECNIKLSEMVKAHNDKLADHDKRLDDIENRPTALWDKVISGVIAAVVAFLMGVVLK